MRWALPAAGLAAFALLLPAPTAANPTDARRAVVSYDAMQRYLFDTRAGHYRERVGAKPDAHAWPFSQALAAAISVAKLPSPRAAADVQRRLHTLERRFRSGDLYTAWPGGDVYFDDNEWIAEALLDWSARRGDAALRARAIRVVDAVLGAWDRSTAHPCAGGVFWTNAARNRDRNTVTTANAALLSLRLYALTRKPAYLTWSRKTLEWVDRCMLAPNGLYWDHIDLGGAVDERHWSYNQGILIGAFMRLYRVTGDRAALARATGIADAALQYFGRRWDGDEPAEFAAVFFRHLLALAIVDGRDDYVAAAEAYGDQAWQTARDPRTGLFSIAGAPSLLEQAALVQLYATLARLPVTSAQSAPPAEAPAP
jgi:hypothetical protein